MFIIFLLFNFRYNFFRFYKNIIQIEFIIGLDNIFVLFTKFRLQNLPKVKLIASSKYWVLFAKMLQLKLPNI